MADKLFVSAFLRQAEEILEIAAAGNPESQNAAIVIDRQGGMRMLDASGWTLPALSAEFGAASVFKVERRGGAVRVEGMAGSERCLLQRNSPARSVVYTQPGVTPWLANSNGTCAFSNSMRLLPPSPSRWYC
ncbi:MAG TPA: hypothetical protein VGS58_04900 [Candidatus Sulfopaludibacter sp.]|nr:hypothetical protein [Candidatus Sulfopaludibacter sp.]